MPTVRLPDDSPLNANYLKKYGDEAKKRLSEIGHDPRDVGLMIERVHCGANFLHCERCPRCNDAVRHQSDLCRPCERYTFRHQIIEDMHFLTEKLGVCSFRIIFYLKSQRVK